MSVLEIFILGAALSMDAFAVGMTNGMSEPKMKYKKVAFIAFAYGFFQFLMPLAGYYGSAALSDLLGKIAPWLSFGLLAFLGGKTVIDCTSGENSRFLSDRKTLGAGRLLAQSVATSIDALAAGVAFRAQEMGAGLPFHAALCSLVVGAVTFFLSFAAVCAGRTAGGRLAEKAELAGGLVLVALGVKLLIEGVLGT